MYAFMFVALLNAGFLAVAWWSFGRLSKLQQKRLHRGLAVAYTASFFTYVLVFSEQAETLFWSWAIVVCVVKMAFELIEKWLKHHVIS